MKLSDLNKEFVNEEQLLNEALFITKLPQIFRALAAILPIITEIVELSQDEDIQKLLQKVSELMGKEDELQKIQEILPVAADMMKRIGFGGNH